MKVESEQISEGGMPTALSLEDMFVDVIGRGASHRPSASAPIARKTVTLL